MLFSSCTASWTPPWAGSPMVSQALKPLQPLTKGLMCGWAIHVPTHLVCMTVSLVWFVSLHKHVQQMPCRDSCVMSLSGVMRVAVPALSVLFIAISLYCQSNFTLNLAMTCRIKCVASGTAAAHDCSVACLVVAANNFAYS